MKKHRKIGYFRYLSIFLITMALVQCSCATPTTTEVQERTPAASESILASPNEFTASTEGIKQNTNTNQELKNINALSWEMIASDFQVSAEEMEVLGKLFVEALKWGPKSMKYQALCAPMPERCSVLDQYFSFMSELNGDRREARKSRRKMDRRFSISDKNIAKWQTESIRRLMSGLVIKDEKKFYKLANLALESGLGSDEKTCPKNLSATLSIRIAKYFPSNEARELSQKLFDQAELCLSKDDTAWESLYLRQGLYAYASGGVERAERLLLKAMEGKIKSEDYRSLYWLGKITEQKGIKNDDNQYWKALVENYPLSYYAIKVQTAWGKDPLDQIPDRVVEYQRFSKIRPELNQRLRWLEVLILLGEREHVKRWMEWLSYDSKDVETNVIHYISGLLLENEYFRSNIALLMKYYRIHSERVDRFGLRSMYPRPFFEDIQEVAKDRVEPYLLMGLIRQESAFDPRAVSSARAKGLMQIIPKTARRLLHNGDKKLFDEKHNVSMGTKYLSRLGDRFYGEVELALAAYNAGPNRVEEWLERFPDRKDPLLWNDLIPYQETRDYVTSILRNNYWYERLYPSEKTSDRALASKLIEELTSTETEQQ